MLGFVINHSDFWVAVNDKDFTIPGNQNFILYM